MGFVLTLFGTNARRAVRSLPLQEASAAFFRRYSRKGTKPRIKQKQHIINKTIRTTQLNDMTAKKLAEIPTAALTEPSQFHDGNTVMHAIATAGNSVLFEEASTRLDKYKLADALSRPNHHGATPFYNMAASGHRNLLRDVERLFSDNFKQLRAKKEEQPDESTDIKTERLNKTLWKMVRYPVNCGITPLLAATHAAYRTSAIILLSKFGNTGTYSAIVQNRLIIDSPLSAFLRQGDFRSAEYLLERYKTLIEEGRITAVSIKATYRFQTGMHLKGHLSESSPNTATKTNILHLAAACGSPSLFKKLFQSIQDLDPDLALELITAEAHMRGYDLQPLHVAAEAGCSETVRYILAYFKKIGHRDQYVSNMTRSARTALDLSLRNKCVAERHYQHMPAVIDQHRRTHDTLKVAYKNYSDIVESEREAVINNLKTNNKDAWQYLRELDERLFVGTGSGLFIERIMNLFKLPSQELFIIKKAVHAANIDSTETFEAHIATIEDTTILDYRGISILHLCARLGCSRWTDKSILDGLNPDIRETAKRNSIYLNSTALFEACYFLKPEIIRKLNGYGADLGTPRTISGSFPLNILVWSGEARRTLALLKSRTNKPGNRKTTFDYNQCSRNGRGLLYLAICSLINFQNADPATFSTSDVIALIDHLVANGSDTTKVARALKSDPIILKPIDTGLSTTMLDGEIPLHLAARIPETEGTADTAQIGVQVARLLIRTAAKTKALNSKGLAAMHIAAAHGNLAFIKLLIAKGFDPYQRSVDGRLPIEMVTAHNPKKYHEIRMYLAEAMRGEQKDFSNTQRLTR